MLCAHRASKSPRAVTDETENRSTNSRTVTCPFCSMSSRILRRRCSARGRESLPVIIKVESLAAGVGRYGLALPYFIHPKENKRKSPQKEDFPFKLVENEPLKRVGLIRSWSRPPVARYASITFACEYLRLLVSTCRKGASLRLTCTRIRLAVEGAIPGSD